MKVTYDIPGTIAEVLDVVIELNNIAGIEPERITTDDNRQIRFNKSDHRRLVRGELNEEKYIALNAIS